MSCVHAILNLARLRQSRIYVTHKRIHRLWGWTESQWYSYISRMICKASKCETGPHLSPHEASSHRINLFILRGQSHFKCGRGIYTQTFVLMSLGGECVWNKRTFAQRDAQRSIWPCLRFLVRLYCWVNWEIIFDKIRHSRLNPKIDCNVSISLEQLRAPRASKDCHKAFTHSLFVWVNSSRRREWGWECDGERAGDGGPEERPCFNKLVSLPNSVWAIKVLRAWRR